MSEFAVSRRLFLGGSAALGAALLAPAGRAAAASFPSKPVEILLGVGPGGGTDLAARMIGPHWQRALGGSQPVTYVQMPGASGLLALNHLLKGKPDGHMAMFYPIPHIATSFELNKVPGKTNADVAWLGAMFNDPNVLLVKKDARWTSIADFIAEARTSSRPFTISGSTPMSNAHFSTVVLRELTGANLKFVPFGSGADARNAVAGGHVDACLAPYWSAIGVLEMTKAIGIFQDKNPAPNLWQPVPVNEVLDVKIPNLSEPYAMFVSSAVREKNPDVFAQLVSSYGQAVASPEFRAAADKDNLTPFLVDWDADRCSAFVTEYVALVKQYLPAMEKDLKDM
jgi:tripartite-type tricarboxylate transporter receptor subunit TctC